MKSSPPVPEGFPLSYRVRDLEIRPALALAPMEGVTDLTFRRLVRGIGGPGLTCTEFIPSEGLKRGAGKAWRMAQFDPDERPVSVQIFGRRPEVMAEAARMVQDMGASICDINMGCPSKRVCANSGGSALMKEPALAGEIVRQVRAAIQIPLTVKMRSGFDHSQRNAVEISRICQEEGAEALAIHWRTRSDAYKGTRQVDRIAAAVDAVQIPVLANGDIVDLDSAAAMVRETGCAGLMIGRGAIRDPWIFQKIDRWSRGLPLLVVDAEEKERALLRYFRTISEAIPREKAALGRMKMLCNHFTRGLPHGVPFRTALLRSQTRASAESLVRCYFAALRDYEAGESGAFRQLQFLRPAEAEA